MQLPNPGMESIPFTPLTAEFVDDMIENIEALAVGVGSITINSNGTSIRYGNGTQICFHTQNYGAGNVNGAGTFANQYRTGTNDWVFPQEFSATPSVSGQGSNGAGTGAQNYSLWVYNNISNTQVTSAQVFIGSNNSSNNVTARMMAIGPWN